MVNNAKVYVTISPGPVENIENNSLPSKASIYFVAVAFFVVVIVTLIWIIVYYIQKYRYYNAKKRLDVRISFISIRFNFNFQFNFFLMFVFRASLKKQH
jgi:hypothetical protein